MDRFNLESRPGMSELLDVKRYECRENICQAVAQFTGRNNTELDIGELELAASLSGRLTSMIGNEVEKDSEGKDIVIYYYQEDQ